MAHTHFNGTCEQSARNRNGAINKNFNSSDRLGLRMACQKNVTPYLRAFSGCLVPLAYDEDPDYETDRGVFTKDGFKNARKVRSYCAEYVVFADETKCVSTVMAHSVIPDEVQAILRKVTRKETVSRKEAQQVTNFILTCPRIAKPIRDKFVSRKIGALQALRLAGLYSVKK